MTAERPKLSIILSTQSCCSILWICCSLLALAVATAEVSATRAITITTTEGTALLERALHFVEASNQPQKKHGFSDIANANVTEITTVHTFSPHVDYNSNDWRPVGRGDPLKNDPTFDYSPPALERVRYWADTRDKAALKGGPKNDETVTGATTARAGNAGKNEVLLLGLGPKLTHGSGVAASQPIPHVMKNVKGETPVLQPKYNSAMRRSYYAAQQMPRTHLMPPPMFKSELAMPLSDEYRQHMPSAAAQHSTTGSTSTAALKQQHSTSGMASWQHHSHKSENHLHSQPLYPHDHHQYRYGGHLQESANYLSNTRSGGGLHQNALKPNSAAAPQRKLWLQELLQKEVVKPTVPSKKYFASIIRLNTTRTAPYALATAPSTRTTKSSQLPPHAGLSTKLSITSSIYITPTPPPTPESTPSAPSTPQPIGHISSSTVAASTITLNSSASNQYTPTFMWTTIHPTLPMSSQLLIPNTNNLLHRPTVAPMILTTDSLFKHYNQPQKPLRGPMYLIIEGHSKVKKYGKNEIDLHQPKIVPIISKREPVVRIADPNEGRRGTPESYLVKHLHTKSTTQIEHNNSSLTAIAVSTTATNKVIPKTPPPTTTNESLESTTVGNVQGLLGLLSDMFPVGPNAIAQQIDVTTFRTILKPVLNTSLHSAVGSHIISNTGTILSEDEEDKRVTVSPPREVRQIFDYDQQPNARLKQLMTTGIVDDNSALEDWIVYEDDEDSANGAAAEYEDDGQQFIKRIDQLMDDVYDDQLMDTADAPLAVTDENDIVGDFAEKEISGLLIKDQGKST